MEEKKGKHPGGRPQSFTPELAEEICNVIAETTLGLNPLCELHKHWPSSRTIRRWIRNNREFCLTYAQAKLDQADLLAEQCLEIADNDSKDFSINDKGEVVCDYDNIMRARLRVDTRKWLSSKLAPKIYGESKISENTHKVTVEETTQKVRDADSKYEY